MENNLDLNPEFMPCLKEFIFDFKAFNYHNSDFYYKIIRNYIILSKQYNPNSISFRILPLKIAFTIRELTLVNSTSINSYQFDLLLLCNQIDKLKELELIIDIFLPSFDANPTVDLILTNLEKQF